MPRNRTKFFRLFTIYLVLLNGAWLAGCSGLFSDEQAPDSFVPPTADTTDQSLLLIPATQTPTSPPRDLRPTPTPACTNILGFLEDLSIPDGTVFHPGEQLDKRWRVVNNGTCNWDERYSLKLVSGLPLGTSSEQALFPARSGAQADIRLVFIAPDDPGTYRSAWQAYDPEDTPFGDQFYIEFVVEAQTP